VAVLDRELGVQHLGGEEVARMGPDAARLQAGPFLSWVEPEHRDRLEALVGDALDGRQARSRGVVSGLLAGGGAPKALEISAGPLRGRDGEVQGILVLWVDVSEEWEARQALEATRQRLELSLDAGQHGTYDIDLVTGRGEVSDLYARMLGYDPEDFEESVESWSARLHPEDRERALAAAQGIIHGEANHYHVEFRQRTASGAWLWIRSVARPLERDADGRPTRLIGTHTDISREKETERTRDLLSTAVEQSSSLVLITDPDGVIEYVNPAFEQVTGYAAGESVGRDAAFLRSEGHPEALPPEAWERVRAGESVELEVVNRRKDGIDYRQHTVASPIVTDDGRVRSVVVIGRDVTSERILEDQLRQAQKMEAVGQLTGGIAHDFNNVLTGILSNIRLALDEVPEEADGLRQEIEEVRKAARHGAGLVRKLMAFSRDTYLDRVPVRVAEVVEEVGRFLSRLLPATIDLELDSLAPAAVVSLDPSAVQQILLNLASNARDAMPSGGALRITSRVDETEDRWVLEVEDQGVGMAPDVVERIFEPFFTTKSQGTGLGLAMVYALTERQEGRLSVSSTPGRGTLFRLSFPLSDEEPVSREEPSPPAEAGPGHGRVLVVEDEPAVRRAAQRILERSGYQVQVAEDGVRGLEVLQRDTDGIDLVVTDMVMPGMGGVELWRAAGRGRPGTPLFLFTSGYAEHDLTEELGEAAGSRFLRKPWDGGELLAVVHQSLQEARG
jgi:two-component system NtrC family sensor kinase